MTAPFMAEVAFSQRDFEGVREHLASLSPSAASKSPMAEVVRFWCGEG